MKPRTILHSDLNNFYASVECLHNPELRDKPLVVCGDAELRHGIVLSKNYLAKSYGIRTAETIQEAKRRCPDLVLVKADYKKYLRFSQLTREIYDSFTDKVESFGIDECWLDVTGEDGKIVADEIRRRIKTELGITASIGVSWNKIYAKLGSDMKKPDATTVIDRDNYKNKIFKLPAEDYYMWGEPLRQSLKP